jgi:hypothetical protein
MRENDDATPTRLMKGGKIYIYIYRGKMVT